MNLLFAMKHRNTGFSLIEVLVALLITAIGLLGMLALQARTQESQLETFQRTQALALVEEMANRILANESARRCYGITTAASGASPFAGVGNTDVFACAGFGNAQTRTVALADIQDWQNMLLGASETVGGVNVGGLVGARGCIRYIPVGVSDERFEISVAWAAPKDKGSVVATNKCAENQYGTETQRKVVSVVVEISLKSV